jgi:NAD(P)H-hydrate epimerase
MCGAPALVALGAHRAGAGLVRIAVPRSAQPVVAGLRIEATTAGLAETAEGGFAEGAVRDALALAEEWDAVVLGPGAGRGETTLAALRRIAVGASRPLVLDADGLFAFAGEPDALAGRAQPLVITPHEGEAARLLGRSSKDVRVERDAAAMELVRRTGAVVVLKGPGTIVTDGDRLFRAEAGGPWLATGGTGDVLSGVVAALLAGLPDTGGDPFGAAALAVHLHATAADHVAAGRDRGLLATDVANALPDAIARHLGLGPGTKADAS